MLLKLMYEPHELTLAPGKPLPGGPWLPGGPRPPGAPWRTQMRWHRIYSLQSAKVTCLLHVLIVVHKITTIRCLGFVCIYDQPFFLNEWTHTTVLSKMHFTVVFPPIISFSKCCYLVLNVLVPFLPLGQQDQLNQAVLSILCLLCPPDKIINNKIEHFSKNCVFWQFCKNYSGKRKIGIKLTCYLHSRWTSTRSPVRSPGAWQANISLQPALRIIRLWKNIRSDEMFSCMSSFHRRL